MDCLVNRTGKVKIYFFQVLFLGLLGLLHTGCTSHQIDGGKVYYVHWNEASGRNKDLIVGADAETFEELSESKYARDKNSVYYEAGRLKDADPLTFTPLLAYYGKDKQFAYKGYSKIDGANARTFEILDGGPYSRDHKDYYFDTIRLNVNDYKSFKILTQESNYGYWAKDRSHYYINSGKYPLADYDSFINLEGGYARDKFKVYFSDSIVEGADPGTFRVKDFAVAEDKDFLYDGRTKRNIKDRHSFEVIQNGYSKDKFFVYYEGAIVQTADPLTFEVVSWDWARDKKSYFFHGKYISYIDRGTFKELDYSYGKDKYHVYYDTLVIEGADPKTFIHIEGSQDGRDKNNCYHYGEKVNCNEI